MCKIAEWAEEKIKKMSMLDMTVVKTASAIIGIIIGAYISVFVQQNVAWFVGVFVVLMVYLMCRVFKK